MGNVLPPKDERVKRVSYDQHTLFFAQMKKKNRMKHKLAVVLVSGEGYIEGGKKMMTLLINTETEGFVRRSQVVHLSDLPSSLGLRLRCSVSITLPDC